MKKKTKIWVWIGIAVVAVLLISILLSDVFDKSVGFGTFVKNLREDSRVSELYFDGYKYSALDKDGDVLFTCIGLDPFNPGTITYLESQGVPEELLANTIYKDPNAGSVWSSLLPFLGIGVVALIFFLIMRSASGAGNAAMNIGKNKAHVQNNLRVRFSDVAGAEEEKEELQEIVEFLRAPKRFSNLGARIPSGVLLVEEDLSQYQNLMLTINMIGKPERRTYKYRIPKL